MVPIGGNYSQPNGLFSFKCTAVKHKVFQKATISSNFNALFFLNEYYFSKKNELKIKTCLPTGVRGERVGLVKGLGVKIAVREKNKLYQARTGLPNLVPSSCFGLQLPPLAFLLMERMAAN